MRLNRLDVLRAIAVFLVLGRHVYTNALWFRSGWMGVDLFFVLSGFLVTGLLLSEQRKTGGMKVVRFWVRRAFKIYPPFYVLLGASVLFGVHQQGRLLPEALFFQNYARGWWHHTWSLAVEEHFYLLLPIGLWLLARASRGRPDPFERLPVAVAAIALIVLALRIIGFVHAPVTSGSEFFFRHVCPTHLRIDSLAFGALLSWLCQYRAEAVARLERRHLVAIAIASALAISPALFVDVEGSVPMATIGLTALYLGFGGLLLVVLRWPAVAAPEPVTALGDAVGYIGRHSYSIYLWHLPIKLATEAWFVRFWPRAAEQIVFAVYATLSVVVGVVLAKLIETPMLRLRDRWFPREPRLLA